MAWIGIFDTNATNASEKFSYKSVSSGILCLNDNTKTEYVLSASNAFMQGLYCYNGTLFALEKIPLTYKRSDSSTCGLISPSVDRHISETLVTNSAYLANFTGHSDAESLPIDRTKDSSSYYNSLPRLTIYLEQQREDRMKTLHNARGAKIFNKTNKKVK